MKNRAILTIIICVLIVSLNACSFKTSDDKQNEEENSNGLTVLSWMNSKIDDVIYQFNTAHPETKIQDKRYFANDEGGMKEKAITELMAGKGPDVLLFKATEFPNLHKILENNSLYDLNKLIQKDKSFKMEDYNQIVMDSCVFNNKRNLIPLYSNLPVMITTKGFLQRQGFNIPESGITWTELTHMAKEFANNSNNKNKYMFSNDFSFESLIQCSYMKYIDYSKKKSNFDSDEFISLLNMCKELQPAVCPSDIAKTANSVQLLTKGVVGIVKDDNTLEVSNLFAYNGVCKQFLGEEMFMIPFPSDQQKAAIIANVRVVAGINANCKKPQEAFEFIKLLLAEENQTPYINNIRNYVKGTPVNNKAWKEELKYYINPEFPKEKHFFGDEVGFIEYVTSPLSSNLGDKVDKLYTGITKAEVNDYRVLSILTEETKSFLAGKTSAEKTAEAINNKVMLYLNE